jgi:hypothetical protein
MQDADIKLRVNRIVRGENRPDDLDRIFLFFRFHHCNRYSVRDVGDFIAHRDERKMGAVTGRARDMLLSCRQWLLTMHGIIPSFEDIKAAAQATLRVATDKQLKDRLNLSRGKTEAALARALDQAEGGVALKGIERKVLNYLGGTFIWNVAYTDTSLLEDLIHVLRFHKFLEKEDVDSFRKARDFLALHVIATLHGTPLVMDKKEIVHLRATFSHETRQLGLKAELPIANLGKPIMSSVFLVHTELVADKYCDPALLIMDTWAGIPLEFGSEGKLAAMR